MRPAQLSLACSLLLATGVATALGDSIALSSYSELLGQYTSWSHGDPPVPISPPVRVSFSVAQWIPGVGATNKVDVGQLECPEWEPNSSGVFDFTPAMTGFSAVRALWTDGQPGVVYMNCTFHVSPNSSGYISQSRSESRFFAKPTDWSGYQIDFVRLHLNQLTWTWNPATGYNQVLVDTTWEVWGQPVPEPASALLALVGLTALRRR
jgi:hypothetical protein